MSDRVGGPAPVGLRIVHAIVFLGFASAAVAGTHVELFHLERSLVHPYHSGTLPQVLPCVGGLLSIFLSAFVVLRLVLHKSMPLAVSVMMLLAFGLSFTILLGKPEERSVPGANVKALEAARALHQPLNDALQSQRRVPDAVTPPPGDSPFRRRGYTALPWHVANVARTDALPDGAEPGWLLLHVNDDRAGFSVSSVGVNAEGEAMLLRDESGDPIELRGAFNPDTQR